MKKTITIILLLLGLSIGFLLFGSQFRNPALAANGSTLIVTKTEDTNDGACNTHCSLREAIEAFLLQVNQRKPKGGISLVARFYHR